jgi:hypothetical protein
MARNIIKNVNRQEERVENNETSIDSLSFLGHDMLMTVNLKIMDGLSMRG